MILFSPAGGSFTVEIAGNKAQTTFSYGGIYTSNFGDGLQHPDNYSAYPNCIGSPNSKFLCRLSHLPARYKQLNVFRTVHCKNESDAAGTAFAISYQVRPTPAVARNLVHTSDR